MVCTIESENATIDIETDETKYLICALRRANYGIYEMFNAFRSISLFFTFKENCIFFHIVFFCKGSFLFFYINMVVPFK